MWKRFGFSSLVSFGTIIESERRSQSKPTKIVTSLLLCTFYKRNWIHIFSLIDISISLTGKHKNHEKNQCNIELHDTSSEVFWKWRIQTDDCFNDGWLYIHFWILPVQGISCWIESKNSCWPKVLPFPTSVMNRYHLFIWIFWMKFHSIEMKPVRVVLHLIAEGHIKWNRVKTFQQTRHQINKLI